MADVVEKLAYRIEEMEKKMAKMDAMFPPVDSEVTDEVEGIKMSSEEELPKLDGAPLEPTVRFSADTIHKPHYGKKVGDSQSSFLAKLYN